MCILWAWNFGHQLFNKMEADEEIVFEGSALHEHLKSLNLIEADEDHPSRASCEACTPLLSHLEHLPSPHTHEYQKKSLWETIKFGLYLALTEFKRIKRKLLLVDQLEKEMLSYLALLVCSKGLLTPDDRLHLYYFSPIFSNLVEEPALVSTISEQESRISYTLLPSTSLKGAVAAAPIAATAGAVIAVSSALLLGGTGSTLSYAGEDFKDSCYQAVGATSIIWIPLLALLLTLKTARTVVCHRYTSAYKQTKDALLSLASLQSSCLPPAFSAAADAALLVSPAVASGCALRRRVDGELARLRHVLHDTLSCVSAALAPGTAPPLTHAGTDEWTRIKAIRRDLELQISALARDILLEGENSSVRKPLPNSTRWSRATADSGGSVLHVMEASCRSLAEVLPGIQALSSAVTSQVGLLRHCWLYSEEDRKPPQERTAEEVSSAAALMRHMQECLLLLDQVAPDLREFSLIPLPDSSESRESLVRKYNNIQAKVDSLLEEFKLCQHDLEVLSESLAARKLRLLREPGENSHLNPEVKPNERTEQKSNIPELHVIPLTPYIAEDEFFEASTEDRGDMVEETSKWDAENEQDEQIRRQVVACNKRVLSELRPILVRKKEEFRQREEKAKRRMQGDCAGENCIQDDGTDNEIKVPASASENGVIHDEALNVLKASLALHDAGRPSLSQHTGSVSTTQLCPSNPVEIPVCQNQNSAKSSRLQSSSIESQFLPQSSTDDKQLQPQNSPGETQFQFQNSTDENQYHLQNSTDKIRCSPEEICFSSVAGLTARSPEGQASLPQCGKPHLGGLGLCDLNTEPPGSGGPDASSEVEHRAFVVDHGSSGSSSGKGHIQDILTSDVEDDCLFNGGGLNREDRTESIGPPNYHELFGNHYEHESKAVVFESAACDSRVRSPGYVVRDEEFESLPDQNDDGDARWNVRARPRDLKERLQLMMENQRKELGNSDQVPSGQLDLQRSSEECSWGFPSHLAAEAVRLSSKFGVGEETFGGTGEGEEEFFGELGESDDEGSEDPVKKKLLLGDKEEGRGNIFGEVERDYVMYEESGKKDVPSSNKEECGRNASCKRQNENVTDSIAD